MNILIDNFQKFLEVAIESFNIIRLLAKNSDNNKSNDNNNNNNNNNNNDDDDTKTIASDVFRAKQELRQCPFPKAING